MKQYDVNSLVIHPGNSSDAGVIVELTPQTAGWDTLSFQVRHLTRGSQWSQQFDQMETAIVMLSGIVDIQSNHGNWSGVGSRESVFTACRMRYTCRANFI